MPIIVSTMSPNMCPLCPRSIQEDSGGAGGPGSRENTGVSQAQREGRHGARGPLHGLRERANLRGLYVAQELQREVDSIGPDRPDPAGAGGADLGGGDAQGGPHCLGQLDGDEDTDSLGQLCNAPWKQIIRGPYPSRHPMSSISILATILPIRTL